MTETMVSIQTKEDELIDAAMRKQIQTRERNFIREHKKSYILKILLKYGCLTNLQILHIQANYRMLQ